MPIGKYTLINFSERVPPARFPASGVAIATLDGVAHLAGVGNMLGEGLVTNTMGSLGKSGDLGSTIGEAFVSPPLFNQVKADIGSANGEAVATCLFGIWGGFGAGGAVDIYDEGVLVVSGATSINFTGADVMAQIGSVQSVDVFVPPPAFPSHFTLVDGTTTATVPDISTTNRYVSAPTIEGTPFYTGGGVPWGGDGSTHATTRTSPLVWTPGAAAGNLCLFEDLLSTITVTLSDSSGVIETHTTAAITGNTVSSSANITVSITNWAVSSFKYQANISVSVDINSMLPNSGYFDLIITHLNGGTSYTKTQ